MFTSPVAFINLYRGLRWKFLIDEDVCCGSQGELMRGQLGGWIAPSELTVVIVFNSGQLV